MHSTPADNPHQSDDDWSWDAQQSRYTLVDAINRAVEASQADGELVGGYEMQLALLLDRYAGRRTIEARMVRDVAELAVGRVAEVEASHAAYVRGLVDSHAAETQRLRDRAADLLVERDHFADELRGARVVEESRRRFDDGKVSCTFTNGFSVAMWTPAQLEEVAYRVRAAGGGDDEAIHVRLHDSKATGLKPVELVAYLPDMATMSFDLSTPQRPGARPGGIVPAPSSSAAEWTSWWGDRSRAPVKVVAALVVAVFLFACFMTGLEWVVA